MLFLFENFGKNVVGEKTNKGSNLISTQTIAANQASIKLDISTYKVGQYFAQLSSHDLTIQKKITFSVQR